MNIHVSQGWNLPSWTSFNPFIGVKCLEKEKEKTRSRSISPTGLVYGCE